MKLNKLKKQFFRAFKQYQQPMLIGVVLIALATMFIYKRPAQAASDRAKTAAAVIVGAGVGGGLAGGLGGAKWAVPGIAIGGLSLGLLARAIRKNRERRNGALVDQGTYPMNYQPRNGRRHRYRNQYPMAPQQTYQPSMQEEVPAYNYPNQAYGIDY
jgi:hypothetical protein